jgi:hypothetical protein
MVQTLEWSIGNEYLYALLGDGDLFGSCGYDTGSYRYINTNEYLSDYPNLADFLNRCAWRDERTKLVVTSDLLRLHYLAHNNNVLYVDSDARFVGAMEDLDKDVPSFAHYGPLGMVDSMVIYGNKQSVLSDVYMQLREMITRSGVPSPMFCDLHIVLNSQFAGRVNQMSPDLFLHKVYN